MMRGSSLRQWRVPLLLFAATVATTTLAGAAYAAAGRKWQAGLPFTPAASTILLTQ
jgi:hypothetical protein